MNVVVDTAVWSVALRRKRGPEPTEVGELAELIQEGRVLMLGPIRQEILSGLRETKQFQKLRDHLQAFPDVALSERDFENAAECFNRCRARGVQGSNTDFLICAVALRLDASIFTTDEDFKHFARVLKPRLHAVRKS